MSTLVALLSTPTGPSPSYAGDPIAGHSTPGRASPEQSKEGELPPMACWPLC